MKILLVTLMPISIYTMQQTVTHYKKITADSVYSASTSKEHKKSPSNSNTFAETVNYEFHWENPSIHYLVSNKSESNTISKKVIYEYWENCSDYFSLLNDFSINNNNIHETDNHEPCTTMASSKGSTRNKNKTKKRSNVARVDSIDHHQTAGESLSTLLKIYTKIKNEGTLNTNISMKSSRFNDIRYYLCTFCENTNQVEIYDFCQARNHYLTQHRFKDAPIITLDELSSLKRYPCNFPSCNYVDTVENLIQHQWSHCDEEKCFYPECRNKEKEKILHEHFFDHHSLFLFQCTLCPQILKSRNYMLLHLQYLHTNRRQCVGCSKMIHQSSFEKHAESCNKFKKKKILS